MAPRAVTRTLFILAGLTGLAYLPVWWAQLVYEDVPARLFVVSSPLTHWIAGGRPVFVLSRMLDGWLVGNDPRWPHLFNVGVHLVNGYLVYRLVRIVAGAGVAVLAAGLFWLHPLQTEAVAYVASRTELLMTLFVLTAVLLALRPFAWWRALVLLTVAVLAPLSKETGVVVVALIPLAWWVRRARLARLELAALIGVGIVGLVRVVHVVSVPYVTSTTMGFPVVQHGPIGFVCTQAAAWWRLMALIIWPFNLTVDHQFAAVTPLIGIAALVCLVAWVIVAVAPDGNRLVSAAMLWPAITMAPRFIVRNTEYLNEHTFYLPMVALVGLLAVFINACSRSWNRGGESLYVY